MGRDIAANLKLHWTLAAVILACDVALTLATIYLEKTNTNPVPQGGETDKSAPIGWMSVFSALFIFGTFGFCIKTPSVQEANVDVMVWQCYYSLAVVLLSVAIWLATGASEGLTFSASSLAYGCAFAVLWIASQLGAFKAIQILGYAVGPAIWVGATIVVSFMWGSLVFGNPVHNMLGASAGLTLLVLGVRLATLASKWSDSAEANTKAECLAEKPSTATQGTQSVGFACALICGLCNGTIMVPMTCFQQGCFGSTPFSKDQIPAMAFLPSLSAGIAIAQPILFLLYWAPSMLRGEFPDFQAKAVAGPGLYTGMAWGMGNFNAMFATVYLGQTIGFPLCQCCLVVSGALGIVYFQELRGRAPVGLFCLASLVICVGAALDGIFG